MSASPLKPLPPSNRILATGWAEQQHAAHQARLASIKPHVDSAAPKCARVKITRLKAKVLKESNNERIDRENRILLQRMSDIHSRPSPALPPPTAQTPAQALALAKARSLNSHVRAKEQERIAEENLALVARLKRGRGNQEALLLEKHEREYQALRDAGMRARLPPASLPAPQYGATSSSPFKVGSLSDRMLSPQERAWLRKSSSQSSGITRSGGVGDKTLGSSASMGSGLSHTLTRPLEELEDENGAVDPITADTYPSLTPRSAAASSKYTVQLKQDGSKSIDGRSSVMITVDEMNADMSAVDSNAQQAMRDSSMMRTGAVRAADPALLHCFLFRTFESRNQNHDYVSVPFVVVASLPECESDPSLINDLANREQLADKMIARLRFHAGRLAFNPSRALGLPAKTKTSKHKSGGSVSSMNGASSTWDQIGEDGQLHGTDEEDAEWDRAVAGGKRDGRSTPDRRPAAHGKTGSTAGSVTSGPDLAAPPKPLSAIGRHHMSTTLATVLRAGQQAPNATLTIVQARALREKKMAYKNQQHTRSRSTSPKRPAVLQPFVRKSVAAAASAAPASSAPPVEESKQPERAEPTPIKKKKRAPTKAASSTASSSSQPAAISEPSAAEPAQSQDDAAAAAVPADAASPSDSSTQPAHARRSSSQKQQSPPEPPPSQTEPDAAASQPASQPPQTQPSHSRQTSAQSTSQQTSAPVQQPPTPQQTQPPAQSTQPSADSASAAVASPAAAAPLESKEQS